MLLYHEVSMLVALALLRVHVKSFTEWNELHGLCMMYIDQLHIIARHQHVVSVIEQLLKFS